MRHPLWKGFCCLSALWVLLHASTVYSTPLTPKKAVVGGVEGVWLPSAQAGQVLKVYELTQAQKDLIEAQKLVIRSATTTSSLETQQAQAEHARAEEFKNLSTQQAKELESQSSIWHSPFLWLGVGTVIGVVASVFVVRGLNSSVTVVK